MLNSLTYRLITGTPPDPIAHNMLERLLGEWSHAEWILVVALILAVPWAEEVIYRGYVQRGLVCAFRARWPAIIATSVAFTLMHISAASTQALGTLFILSLCLGILRERTGTVTPCIVVHGLFNATNIAMAAAMH